MMTKHFLCFVLLSGLVTFAASKECYIIRPSQSQSCDGHAECGMDVSDLTLSQFINNSSDYLTNDTTLIFSPGSHSLESELTVENVHSFSMFVWPGSSSKAVIKCHGHNARFEFSNVSSVTVSGLEFVGCFENHIISVDQFQLENSGFFGNGQAKVNGTVLSIEESVASLDRVAFISAMEKLQTSDAPQIPEEECYSRTIETMDEVIGILLKRSNVSITQSRFEGNKVGLGAVIYNELSSDVTISNTIFANNSVTHYCSSFCCFPGGIVYVSRQNRSTLKIHHSRFEENIGMAVIILGDNMYTSEWLLRYQDKAIFKWVRYQKLRLFLEPYHAPYTAKYRYWTGLLLFVRVLLYLISILNFSLDPRVDLMATIFIVGGLILLKGVTAKRVYKDWPLDVMETAIYFNLVAFSALTWYNSDFGGNQVAVAYTSVMIIFILLLGVVVFHVVCYTRLYKCSFVEKTFKWMSSKLLEKKPKEQLPNDAPEELDGYRLERSAPGDQELPTVTHSVVEINQPVQNQEENSTEG